MPLFKLPDVTLRVPSRLLSDKLAAKIAAGEYEQGEANAVRKRVKPGHRVLELGGGIGYISSLCATITDPQNILTVEANPDTVDVIRENLALNGASTVKLLHAAVVGDDFPDDTVLFRRGSLFWGSSLADDTSDPDKVVDVPAVLLRALLKQHRPHVVIMDIEGGEQHLFSAPWPAHVRFVLMEIHPRQYPPSVIKTIVDCMSASELTYDPGPSNGTLLCFRKVWTA